MISQLVSNESDKVKVTFSIPSSVWADTIHLVGDFNDWDRYSMPLRHTERGWRITLTLEKNGKYRYRYLFNDEAWQMDSNADEYLPNDRGGYDSVVIT